MWQFNQELYLTTEVGEDLIEKKNPSIRRGNSISRSNKVLEADMRTESIKGGVPGSARDKLESETDYNLSQKWP